MRNVRFLGDNNEHVSRYNLFSIPVLNLYLYALSTRNSSSILDHCSAKWHKTHPFGEFDIAKGVHKILTLS